MLGLAPAAPAGGQRGQFDAGIGVQQAPHRIGPCQALPGMLAMDIHQVVAHLPQLCGRGRASVDPGTAFTLGVHRAAQQHLCFSGSIRLVKACCVQPLQQRGWAVEFSADLGAGRAFPYQPRVCPRAKHQLQRIDQDRLAGAGFAGQRGEAALQPQVQLLHDDKVAQVHVGQSHVTILRYSIAASRARCRNSSSPPGAGNARGAPSAAR